MPRSQVPSRRQHRKSWETACQRGTSCGIARQGVPPRSTCRILFTTSRRSCLAGRTPRLGAGMRVARTVHPASVRSDGARARHQELPPYRMEASCYRFSDAP
jgi:hypothetical protein